MRYTTIIDVSEFRQLYSNHNLRLVYLHLCLKSSYRDADRDWILISIRQLAAAVGITVSATRHALAQLEKAKLIRRTQGWILVRKFVKAEAIAPRPTNKRQEELQRHQQQQAAEQAAADAKRQEEERLRTQLFSMGKTTWMVYYENQQKAAATGDEKAAAFCVKNKKRYIEESEAMKKNKP